MSIFWISLFLFHLENLSDSLSVKREAGGDSVELIDIDEDNTAFAEAQGEETIMDRVESPPKKKRAHHSLGIYWFGEKFLVVGRRDSRGNSHCGDCLRNRFSSCVFDLIWVLHVL